MFAERHLPITDISHASDDNLAAPPRDDIGAFSSAFHLLRAALFVARRLQHNNLPAHGIHIIVFHVSEFQ
jgi:hypothetical protein